MITLKRAEGDRVYKARGVLGDWEARWMATSQVLRYGKWFDDGSTFCVFLNGVFQHTAATKREAAEYLTGRECAAARREVTRDFVVDRLFAGAAVLTVERLEGERFTYQVERQHDRLDAVWHVSVLTGPSNMDDYTYVGVVADTDRAQYYHDIGSRIGDGAPSVALFRELLEKVADGTEALDGFRFWHEGRCLCCGRRLTVPESIESGIGPVCAEKGA